MISPTNVVGYESAKVIKDRAYSCVLGTLRPEFVNINKAEKEILISFTLLANGTGPRITAIYGDGVREPEVYVDRDDWDNFNSLEFSHLNFPSTDILLDTIKYEFRKVMQHYFKISKVSDSFLELFLFKRENSTIQRAGDHKLKINFFVEDFLVTLELASAKTPQISITKGDCLSLTKNIDLSDKFDPMTAVQQIICKLKNANELADLVLRRVTGMFHVKSLKEFPYAELLVNDTPVEVYLNSDYTHICISARGRHEKVSLEHMDVNDVITNIVTLASECPSDCD